MLVTTYKITCFITQERPWYTFQQPWKSRILYQIVAGTKRDSGSLLSCSSSKPLTSCKPISVKSRDGSVWIVTGLQPGQTSNLGSIPGWGKRIFLFFTFPEVLCGPPSHLFNGKWCLFPGVKRQGREANRSWRKFRMCEAIPVPPHVFKGCRGTNLPLI
jgi:hypothetical protein